jgi:hypothetical protein
MFSPHFGILGGSAEWEPQSAPERQMTVGRNPYAEFDHNLMLPEDPDAGPNKFMHPGQLPLAEEFRPHRPLRPAEIAEMQQPGGAERVAGQLRMEQRALEDIQRKTYDLFVRQGAGGNGGADLPLPPGAPFQRPGIMGGLPQTAPLPPRRPSGLGGY